LEQVYKRQGHLNKPGEIFEKAHDFNALEKIYREIKGT